MERTIHIHVESSAAPAPLAPARPRQRGEFPSGLVALGIIVVLAFMQRLPAPAEGAAKAASAALPAEPAPPRLKLVLDFDQGQLLETGNSTDFAIDGPGFLKVKIDTDSGDGFAYTRIGKLFINSNYELAMDSRDGFRLEPAICVPMETPSDEIQIAEDGTISVKLPDCGTQRMIVGRVELCRFDNPRALKPIGGNMFVETKASGVSIETEAGVDGAGTIHQRFLESIEEPARPSNEVAAISTPTVARP